jgi:hypothetical protein
MGVVLTTLLVMISAFLLVFAIVMLSILGTWFGTMFSMFFTLIRMGIARLNNRNPEQAEPGFTATS